jgi:uncharacterized protein (DUF2461 family)
LHTHEIRDSCPSIPKNEDLSKPISELISKVLEKINDTPRGYKGGGGRRSFFGFRDRRLAADRGEGYLSTI